MQNRLLSLLILLGISSGSFAQAKSVYFELGGPGLASFNFDTRFKKGAEAGIGGRLGVGGFTVDNVGILFLPVGVNYLLGKDNKNYFEVGLGMTPVIASDGDDTFSETFGHLIFGYRLQPLKGGFTFRAFVCPVFNRYGFIPYYAGLSFGYKF